MDKNRVYIGYDCDGKRCLLYKESHHEYIDLEMNYRYYNFQINEESLVRYDQIIKIDKNQRRSKIVNLYQGEENRTLYLPEIYIGSIYQVTQILSENYSVEKMNYRKMRGTGTLKCRFEYRPFKIDAILQKQDNRYIDLMTSQEYGSNILNNNLYVPTHLNDLTSFNEIFSTSDIKAPKKKVLKKYTEKYKKYK